MVEEILDFIFKGLGPGIIAGLLLGGAVVLGWDRRPANWPAYAVRLPLGIHFTIGFGDGYPTRLAADRAAFDQERTAFEQLRAAFGVENRAVAGLRVAAVRWQAVGSRAEAAAAQSGAWRLALADRVIAAPAPAGASELGLCRAADAVLREAGQ